MKNIFVTLVFGFWFSFEAIAGNAMCSNILLQENLIMNQPKESSEQLLAILNSNENKIGPIKIPHMSVQELQNNNTINGNHKIKAIGLSINKTDLDSEFNILNSNFSLSKLYVRGSEALNLINITHTEAFADRMSFLSHEERLKILEQMSNFEPSTKVVEFKQEGKTIALLVTENIIINNSNATLISWVWIARSITPEIAINIRNEIKLELLKCEHDEIVARVDLRNNRSLNFFNSFGFKVKWIFLK